MLMGRRITFWITSEDLLSNQPSAVQAREATMNIANPAMVMRAFKFAATIAAARMVVHGAPKETAVHLCVDMQRMFAEGTDWKMPWLDRILPNILSRQTHKTACN
jgi:hypothetical protein